MPYQASFERHRSAARNDAIKIISLHRRESRAEFRADQGDAQHLIRLRPLFGVQGFSQLLRSPICTQLAMSNLTKRMHASIGSSSRHDGRHFRLKPHQRVFNSLLHRKTIFLSLPANKLATVIFDFQRIAVHECTEAWRSRDANIRHSRDLPTMRSGRISHCGCKASIRNCICCDRNSTRSTERRR